MTETIITALAGTAALVFVLHYSGYKWEKSAEGRNSMLTAFAVGALAMLHALGYPEHGTATLVVWIGITVLFIQRNVLLWKRHTKENVKNK